MNVFECSIVIYVRRLLGVTLTMIVWFHEVSHGMHCLAWFRLYAHGFAVFAWLCRVLRSFAWFHVVSHEFAWFRVVSGGFAFAWLCVVSRSFAWSCYFCNLVWSYKVILIWYTCFKIQVSKLHLRRHFVQITFEIFSFQLQWILL